MDAVNAILEGIALWIGDHAVAASVAAAFVFDIIQRLRPTFNPQGLLQTVSSVLHGISGLVNGVANVVGKISEFVDKLLGQNLK